MTPTELGTFPVICTELCGLGHSIMRSQAIVMTPADFDDVGEEPGRRGRRRRRRRPAIFTSNGCGACHTFKPANATGKIGPDLDNLSEATRRPASRSRTSSSESIVDPDAYVAPGFQPA